MAEPTNIEDRMAQARLRRAADASRRYVSAAQEVADLAGQEEGQDLLSNALTQGAERTAAASLTMSTRSTPQRGVQQ